MPITAAVRYDDQPPRDDNRRGPIARNELLDWRKSLRDVFGHNCGLGRPPPEATLFLKRPFTKRPTSVPRATTVLMAGNTFRDMMMRAVSTLHDSISSGLGGVPQPVSVPRLSLSGHVSHHGGPPASAS